jgi:hypothetical protein
MDGITALQSAPYGSTELIDAVDAAMDDGIDGAELETILRDKWEEKFFPDDLEFWKEAAGPQDARLAEPVTTPIRFLDMVNRSDARGNTKTKQTYQPKSFGNDRWRNRNYAMMR